MDRSIVKSSLIYSIGYHAGSLELEFLDGGLYEYWNIPFEIYHELTTAKSIGAYFIKNIKGQYPYYKIR